ncbi:MAG: hypothetical protein Q9183_004592, partial [Haloplaca sp. 2 TL-2023]
MKVFFRDLLADTSQEGSLTGRTSSGRCVTQSGVDLKDLASKCCDTAKILETELRSLTKSPGGGKREAISKAWLKFRKAKEFERLKNALDEYQKTLDSKLIIQIMSSLGDINVQQQGQTDDVHQHLSQLTAKLDVCQIEIAGRLSTEIGKVIKSNEEQHAQTRQHATAAMESLRFTQDEQLSHRTFLGSLRFSELNARFNEVSPPHSKTFHWMYDHDLELPWDSFPEWLKGKESLYWIHGKAGAGKSTLMKFLVNDPRTHDLLASSSSDSEILIVTHFFWLSGGPMQSSLKGFLCSIIHQVLNAHFDLVDASLSIDPNLSRKRSTEDWSNEELHKLLRRTIAILKQPMCIFIDGLDEFDQDNDPNTLLGLIEELASAPTIKLCVSSRPENYLTKHLRRYKQLQLQDLTIDDMRLCIEDTLNRTREKCTPAVVSDEYVEKIIRKIMQKAEGVFLWVHYALASLVKGMRNDDDFGDLLGRIEELPKGMYELYLNMWNRLNGDQDRYRQEAATYFSYQRLEEDMRPSLFELLIVLNPHMQEELVDKLQPQDQSFLTRQCK